MPDRRPIRWTELHLPVPTDLRAARQAVQALASVPGHPRIVLEARGNRGRVRWFMGTDPAATDRVVSAIGPFLGGLRVTDQSGALAAVSVGAAVSLRGRHRSALAADQTEVASRAVLAALAAAGSGEQICIQVMAGPRHRPRRVPASSDMPKALAHDLHGQHRFSCRIRIASTATNPARARHLIQAVAAGLRILEAPGVAVGLRPLSKWSLNRLSAPLIWPMQLSVSELAAVLGWPIASPGTQLPGVPPLHPIVLAPSDRVARSGRILGLAVTEHSRPVAISEEDSLRHLHILGPSGVGKSVLLARLALQDIEAGRGVIVIDPKGDLVNDILGRINPERRDSVVIIDPTDPAPAGIAAFSGDPDRSADLLLSVFRSLYKDALGPRSSSILQAGLLTLARAEGANLAALPMLLSNRSVRRSIVGRVAPADPMGLGAFWGWFEALSDPERNQVVAPLRNKLDPVLAFRPGLRAVFGQSHPQLVLAEVLAKRQVLLISLASGVLGPEGAALLGSLLVALIWQAALERIQLPPRRRLPVMVYIDEMQEVVRLGDLGNALAMARGLGVGFTLAHQSLAQLPESVREAVLANARSRVTFQLSPKDARTIAATTNGQLSTEDFQELPAFQAYGWLLSGGSRTPWCSLASQPLGPPTARADSLRLASRQRYGQPIEAVEQDLLNLSGYQSDGPETFGRTNRAPGQGGSP